MFEPIQRLRLLDVILQSKYSAPSSTQPKSPLREVPHRTPIEGMNATTAKVALASTNSVRYVAGGHDAARSIVYADTSTSGRQVRSNRFANLHESDLSWIADKGVQSWNYGLRDDDLIRAILPSRGRNQDDLRRLRTMFISELLHGACALADIMWNVSTSEKRVSNNSAED